MDPRQIWLTSPWYFLAFGFGSGLMRRAPGTFGTLAAVPLWMLLAPQSLPVYLGVTLLAFLLGIVICDRTAHALGVHDHPGIVWDEVVGFLLTMAAAPCAWWAPVLGFIAFRMFDILKPWPIRWVDRRVTGGFGIMLDDVLAALPAWATVQLAALLL